MESRTNAPGISDEGLIGPELTETTVFPDDRVISYTFAGSDAMFTGTESERDAATRAIAEVWAQDTSFVVDALLARFEGVVDEAAIGIFGHSFGGQDAAAMSWSMSPVTRPRLTAS